MITQNKLDEIRAVDRVTKLFVVVKVLKRLRLLVLLNQDLAEMMVDVLFHLQPKILHNQKK